MPPAICDPTTASSGELVDQLRNHQSLDQHRRIRLSRCGLPFRCVDANHAYCFVAFLARVHDFDVQSEGAQLLQKEYARRIRANARNLNLDPRSSAAAAMK